MTQPHQHDSPGDPLGVRLSGALGEAYQLERELGGGGMSRVFLATERALQRRVVVKVLNPDLVSRATEARFRQEAEVTARLQHPHILPVLATGGHDDLLYYVMPYVEGESLRQRLSREGRIPVHEATRLLYEISDALAYAHARGVVHRDIKPDNVLLVEGHATVADFGIARVLAVSTTAGGGRSEPLTEAGTSLGTIGYMAPEQLAGDPDVDGRADQYALGVVGYEMLSGARPFSGGSQSELLRTQLTAIPQRLDELDPTLPAPLALCVARALEHDPERRFASCGDFRDALGLGFTTGPRTVARRPRRLAVFAVMGIAALALAASLAWFARGPSVKHAADRDLLVVAPFDVLGRDLDMWREGMVDLLSSALDGAGSLRTVSPTVAVRRWSGRADAASGSALARATEASMTVVGRVVRSGVDSVRVQASLMDAGSARALREFDFRVAESAMDRAADSIAVGVLSALRGTRGVSASPRGSIGSSTLSAVRAYLIGEQFYRRGAWDSAATAFQAAIQADSQFGPAMRRLSNALEWRRVAGFDSTLRITYAMRAGAMNRGLAPRESLLVAADSQWSAMATIAQPSARRGMAMRLLATLRAASVQFPRDPEVQFRFGDAQFHFWPFDSAASPGAAGRSMRTAIDLDSAFAPSYLHLIDIAVYEQEFDSAMAYGRRYLGLQPGETDAAAVSALVALLDRAQTLHLDLDSLVTALRGEPIRQLHDKLYNAADPDTALVRLLRVFARDSVTAQANVEAVRRARHRIYGQALADRGRFAEAREASADRPLGYAGPMAWLGAASPDVVRAELDARLASGLPVDALEGIQWRTREGDTSGVKRAVQVTRAFEVRYGALGASYRQVAEAYDALVHGDTAGAIVRLDSVRSAACEWPECDAALLTLAQLHVARGNQDAAARLLSRPVRMRGPVRVVWMLEAARLAERRGDREAALRGYTYVREAWAGADAPVRAMMDEAAAGLARLRR
ncbi:MAG: protein kinase [Gemmatimonadaceae bacterium]|nr:protein kinase [Gemmatimonadaceae bacterium]